MCSRIRFQHGDDHLSGRHSQGDKPDGDAYVQDRPHTFYHGVPYRACDGRVVREIGNARRDRSWPPVRRGGASLAKQKNPLFKLVSKLNALCVYPLGGGGAEAQTLTT